MASYGGLTLDEIARMDVDSVEQLRDEASELGSVEWSFSYDSDGMAGSVWAQIQFYRGLYFPRSDMDLAELGPFATLEEAIQRSGLGECADMAAAQEAEDE
jgi:hypothetical protein